MCTYVLNDNLSTTGQWRKFFFSTLNNKLKTNNNIGKNRPHTYRLCVYSLCFKSDHILGEPFQSFMSDFIVLHYIVATNIFVPFIFGIQFWFSIRQKYTHARTTHNAHIHIWIWHVITILWPLDNIPSTYRHSYHSD